MLHKAFCFFAFLPIVCTSWIVPPRFVPSVLRNNLLLDSFTGGLLRIWLKVTVCS